MVISDYPVRIAAQLDVNPWQVAATIELLEAENTVPFIARYRKEVTGSLDEEQLRKIELLLEKFHGLDNRRQTIISSIEEQGKMTAELLGLIQVAKTLTSLEDLYQPYKPKRTTRASVARQKGLQGLADWILKQPVTNNSLAEIAKPYINDTVPTTDEAWSGARDIAAEIISDHPDIRRVTREKAMRWGILHCEKIEDSIDERGVYQIYYEFGSEVNRLRPHQVLAINRGESQKVIRVRVEVLERDWRNAITSHYPPNRQSILATHLEMAIVDAADRLLLPAIERDVRRLLSESAEQHAIAIFASNLRSLLSQPPLPDQVVLGLDPGFRTGCKVAVVEPTGKVMDTVTIYPHEPQKEWEKSLEVLNALVKKYRVSLISIGNGTASRESEALAAELIQKYSPHVKYLITNEAGASVYSASPLARSELPELDVTLRGAVSIARRVQDPLAELVKIDPKSIGVGLYQHDVNQKDLSKALDDVVESVVNSVGVDVNTSSASLLTHVAGIGSSLAEKIVDHRYQHGAYLDREVLLQVNGLGPKSFKQCAGFLRIHGGSNPLDTSAIHPESYSIAKQVMEKANFNLSTDYASRQASVNSLVAKHSLEKIAKQLNCGVPTLEDIIEQLIRPGRDPRQDAPKPILRSDVLKLDDLVVGMCLKGTVRNVVDFGAFIDIGVKQDGLLHRTKIPRGSNLQVGDIVDVRILQVESERGRIALELFG